MTSDKNASHEGLMDCQTNLQAGFAVFSSAFYKVADVL